ADRGETWGFLLSLGLLTTLLLVDDLFLIHESIQLHFDKSQRWSVLVQGLFAAWFLARFVRIIWSTRWSLLAGAMLCFGGSLVVDFEKFAVADPYHHLLEDGFKMMGIAGWCGYAVLVSTSALRAAFTRNRSPTP